jgi:hypothetical protein
MEGRRSLHERTQLAASAARSLRVSGSRGGATRGSNSEATLPFPQKWDSPLDDERRRVLDVDGLTAAHDLQQQDPEAEDVRLGAEALGRDVGQVEVAEHARGHRRGGADGLGHAENEAKVTEASAEVGVEQDVGGLDVAMDDGRVGVVERAQRPGRLEREAEAVRPARRARVAVEQVVERVVGHVLDDEQARGWGRGGARVGEAEEVDEPWAADGGEDADLVVHLGAARGGPLDGDGAARREHDLVYGPVAASAQQRRVGEVGRGRLHLRVVEALDGRRRRRQRGPGRGGLGPERREVGREVGCATNRAARGRRRPGQQRGGERKNGIQET